MGTIRLILTLLGPIAIYFACSLYRQRRKFRDLPKPPHSFLLGHLNLMREITGGLPPDLHPQAYLTVIAQKYGLKGIWYLDLWPLADTQVVLTEPEPMDAVQVARGFDVHRKAEDSLRPLVGSNAIAAANGPVWKQLHHAMAPAFSTSHVRTQVDLMVAETLLFCDTLKNFSRSKDVFSMEAEASKLVFDIVGRIIFDFPLYAQTKGSPYLEDLKILQKLAKKSQSINPLTKLRVAFEKQSVQSRIDRSIIGKISDRLGIITATNTGPPRKKNLSILDLMLREMLLSKASNKSEKGVMLEQKEIELLTTNIKVLLLAGHGTVVDTLCYIFMLLSKNPDAVQKLRKEHSEVFGEDTSSTFRILEDSPAKANDLVYTTAVIKETLRIFPVGFALREAPPETTLVYDNRSYPIDNALIVPCWHTMHFDPRYYPEPDDFRPERFLNDEVPRSWFRSFSRGPRACLGQNLSLDIMRIILLLTVRDFDFTCHGLEPNAKPKASYTNLDTIYGDVVFQELGGLEARPRGGMMMTVAKSEPRNST
ncbi:cytochrome P450 [Xylaria digitata]|nr:cytochrome P450 [Xylaria digitata]